MFNDNIWKNIKKMTGNVAKGLFVYYYIKEFICDIGITQGPSMEPTIDSNGGVVFIDKFSLMFREVKKEEIVIAKLTKGNSNHLLCKRITGIEGDHKQLKNGTNIIIPKGFIWIEGDNQHNSYDSRKFGPIDKQLIKGRIIFQLFPKFKALDIKKYENTNSSSYSV